jgi:SAM-dependent methyltransferase
MVNFPHPVSLWDHFDIAMVRDFDPFEDTDPRPGQYVQLSPGRKEIRQSAAGAVWDNLDFPEWDANEDRLPYKDDSVNGICTYHSMDHYARPVFVLSEVQRVLKVGGWFVNIAGHYTSELAHNCFEHRTSFAVDVWKNAFSEKYYKQSGQVDGDYGQGWRLRIGFNMIMGLTERNVVLVTQLIKTDKVIDYDRPTGG